MKKSYVELPDNYQKTYELNMKKKKFGEIINLIAIIIMAVLIIIFIRVNNVVINLEYTLENIYAAWNFISRTIVCLLGILIFHEILKVMVMKLISKGKMSIKMNLMIINVTVSNRYFDKNTYLLIRIMAFTITIVLSIVLVLILKNNVWYIPMFVGFSYGISNVAELLTIAFSLKKAKKEKIIKDIGLSIEGYSYQEPLQPEQ